MNMKYVNKILQEIYYSYDDAQDKFHNWNDWEDEDWNRIFKAFEEADNYIKKLEDDLEFYKHLY